MFRNCIVCSKISLRIVLTSDSLRILNTLMFFFLKQTCFWMHISKGFLIRAYDTPILIFFSWPILILILKLILKYWYLYLYGYYTNPITPVFAPKQISGFCFHVDIDQYKSLFISEILSKWQKVGILNLKYWSLCVDDNFELFFLRRFGNCLLDFAFLCVWDLKC